MDVAASLFNLALGAPCPLRTILETGRFPEDWMSDYLKAFRQAEEFWRGKTELPRNVVAAVHAMSVYPTWRYESWRKMSRGGSNVQTETTIAELRTESERFLLGSTQGLG